jgi:hypothetical protein
MSMVQRWIAVTDGRVHPPSQAVNGSNAASIVLVVLVLVLVLVLFIVVII